MNTEIVRASQRKDLNRGEPLFLVTDYFNVIRLGKDLPITNHSFRAFCTN